MNKHYNTVYYFIIIITLKKTHSQEQPVSSFLVRMFLLLLDAPSITSLETCCLEIQVIP
jgi:hypothetical protein